MLKHLSNLSKRAFLPLIKRQSLFQTSKQCYVVKYPREPFTPIVGKYPIECSTAKDAISCIKSDMRVFVHGMCATPEVFIDALCDHCAELNLSNIELIHLLTTGSAHQIHPHYSKHFKDSSFFVSKNVRNAVNLGNAEYIPIFLSEIPLLFANYNNEYDYPIDVSLLHVSPPDNFGFCSLGVSVDIATAAAGSSKILIGLINKYMPRTHGDGQIHISHFNYIFKENKQLPQLIESPIQDHEKAIFDKIGEIIGDNLIEDKATLNIGIGTVPNCIIKNLHNHKDLGLHLEGFGDNTVELIESGVVTNVCICAICGCVLVRHFLFVLFCFVF